jgi:cytochrome P450
MSGTGFIDAPRSAEHFDPFHDPYLADPYPFFAEARAATPVFYSSDLDYWVVTRYHDIRSRCLSSRTPDGGRKQGRPSPSLAVYPAHQPTRNMPRAADANESDGFSGACRGALH